MTTNWALPNTITQYAEENGESAHISWIEIDNFSSLKSLDKRSIKTRTDLVHIARDPKHDITQKTYFLKLTNFNFVKVPNTIQGIEMRLTMQRFGRITDDTIQLTLENNLIGENQAITDLDPIQIYGGDNTIWNSLITSQDILNPTFGVVLRFQSHPRWPHRSTPLIDAVELRIH